jgi:prepilin-type processing-associated H-X9-DG protein
MMYVQDYDEMFPYASFMNGTCVATFYWCVVPYVKNDQVTLCPSEPKAMQLQALTGAPCASTPPYTSYSVNHALFTNGFVPGTMPTALAALNRPAETVMHYDGNVIIGGPPSFQVQVVQGRHNEVFNANYADGHAKSIKAIPTGTTQPQFTAFGPGPAVKIYTIGANGGFYANMIECRGIPQ